MKLGVCVRIYMDGEPVLSMVGCVGDDAGVGAMPDVYKVETEGWRTTRLGVIKSDVLGCFFLQVIQAADLVSIESGLCGPNVSLFSSVEESG